MSYATIKAELEKFLLWVNEGNEDLCYDSTADFYRTAIDESFTRQFTNRAENGSKEGLRVSSLGKPAVLQALKLLGYEENAAVKPSRKLRHIFHAGDTFEAYILMLGKAYGFKVIEMQAEVEFNGVKGHIDAVFSTPAGDALIEVKTMSQRYMSSFKKKQDDDRGYVTQAAVYSHCMGLPLFWLCLDKGSHTVELVESNVEQLNKAQGRAERIIPLLRNVKDFRDVLTSFKAPPAQQEIYRKSPTGLYLLPESMKWSPFAPVFYELAEGENGYGKTTNYVVSYNDVETAEENLQSIVGAR